MNRTLTDVALCSAALLLLAILFVASNTSGVALPRRGDSPTQRTEKVRDLFNRNCARCHGADGRGDTQLGHVFNSPDFTDAEWWKKNANITSPRRLALIVARGKAGMPAFGKKLTKAQIKLLVSHVRRFRK